jgi:hypothetical protein
MFVETKYERKLKIKKRQQAAFRRFIRGQATPINIRDYIGLNWQETKILLESRMQENMTWQNYGSFWVVDHVAPFWIFDLEDEKDLKLLWHPDNLMPMIWADNNHKQGDLRFAILKLQRRKGYSLTTELLISRLEKEIKVQDKYLLCQ